MFLIFTLKKVISSCLFRTLKKLTLFLTVYTVNIRVDEISFTALEKGAVNGGKKKTVFTDSGSLDSLAEYILVR